VNVANAQSGATGVTISSITFAQVAGAACTPVVNAALPIALGQIASGASASDPVTIDFSLCASIARFTVQVTVQANGGAYQKPPPSGTSSLSLAKAWIAASHRLSGFDIVEIAVAWFTGSQKLLPWFCRVP
jgi:hypothetical protein